MLICGNCLYILDINPDRDQPWFRISLVDWDEYFLLCLLHHTFSSWKVMMNFPSFSWSEEGNLAHRMILVRVWYLVEVILIYPIREDSDVPGFSEEGPEQQLRSYYGWKGYGLDTFPFFFHLDATFLLHTTLFPGIVSCPCPTSPPLLCVIGKGELWKESENVSSTTICKFHHYLPVWIWMMYFIALNLSSIICRTGKNKLFFKVWLKI